VLVVDPLEETQEVLRAALGERGVEVVAARDSAHGLALARRSLPSLIVVDLESDGSSAVVTGKLLAESAARSTPLLVIGTARGKTDSLTTGRPLSKPYQYTALIRKIEELLGEVIKGARRRDAKAA
jgi:DNA-binding response OmpR family regulator